MCYQAIEQLYLIKLPLCVLYQSILNSGLKVDWKEEIGRKCAQTGMTASLRILSSKADSNTWESFTRSELKLESVYKESPLLRHLQEKGYQTTSETETSSEASYLG